MRPMSKQKDGELQYNIMINRCTNPFCWLASPASATLFISPCYWSSSGKGTPCPVPTRSGSVECWFPPPRCSPPQTAPSSAELATYGQSFTLRCCVLWHDLNGMTAYAVPTRTWTRCGTRTSTSLVRLRWSSYVLSSWWCSGAGTTVCGHALASWR